MYSNDMWEFHPENPKFWGKFPLQETGRVLKRDVGIDGLGVQTGNQFAVLIFLKNRF